MELTLKAGDLATALKLVKPAVPTKTTLPILTHVLLDARDGRLTISGTNLEISLRTSIPAEVAAIGCTTVPESKLATWVGFQARDTDVTLKGNDKGITLQAGRDRATLPAISADDYPPLPEHEAEPINVSAALLNRALDLALWSVAKEESRPVFAGALMTFDASTLEVVGVNGSTLGFARIDLAAHVPEPTILIVPGRSLAALQGLLPDVGLVEVRASLKGVSFDVGHTTLTSRLIDGIFPDWRRIVPVNVISTAVVNAAALEQQIRSAQMVDRMTPVRFKTDPDAETLTVWARDQDVNHEGVIDGTVTGEPIEVALRADYALETIRALGSETVELRLQGPNMPAMLVIPGSDGVAMQVVMPMWVAADNTPVRAEAP